MVKGIAFGNSSRLAFQPSVATAITSFSFHPAFGAVNFTACADPSVGEVVKVKFITERFVPLSCFSKVKFSASIVS